MKYTNQLKIVNELNDLALIGDQIETKNKGNHVSHGIGETSVHFFGEENIKKFNDGVKQLIKIHSFDKEVKLKKFKDKIYDLIYHLNTEKRRCSIDDLDELYSYFLNIEKLKFEILTPLYGVEMDGDHYKLGEFTIYKKSYIKANRTKDKPSYEDPDKIVDSIDSDYMIGINIEARSQDKAIEVAHEYFRVFENVLKYTIGDHSGFKHPGIFDYPGKKHIKSLAITDKGLGTDSKTLSFQINTKINDDLCKSPQLGNGIIWDLITNPQISEMKRRILNAIEWTGKAIYERDRAKAVVQYVFAIEGLLQLNDKDFITSSIASQIADWLAFIISDDLDSRKKIVKYFKDIYQKRSAVAHGGITKISSTDLFHARYLCLQTISLLLSHEMYTSINKVDELQKLIDNLKYK